MTARKSTSILDALTATNKTGKSTSDPVTLASIVGSPDYVDTLTMLTGRPATDRDAAAIGSLVVSDVKARLLEVSKAAAALARSLTADDVRVSSKDGVKAYAYAVVKPESGAATIGHGMSDGIGASLAKHAKR